MQTPSSDEHDVNDAQNQIHGAEPAGNEAIKPHQYDIKATPGDSSPTPSTDKARGAFDVRSKRKGGEGKRSLYLMMAGTILVALLIVIGGWALVISKMKEGSTDIDESKVKADATLNRDTVEDTSMKQLHDEKVRQEQAAEAQKKKDADELRAAQDRANNANSAGSGSSTANAATGAGNGSNNNGSSTQGQNGKENLPPTPSQRKLAGGVLVMPSVASAAGESASGSDMAGSRQPSSSQGPDVIALQSALQSQAGGSGPLGGGDSEGSTPRRGSLDNLSGTHFTASRAYLMPPRKYLLPHNSYTRCILYNEIVTDQPSLIECKLTQPVYSADGSTVLAEAGDRLTGEQTVENKPGQVRVFTSWTELETQSGVRINLASLGAGPMGASGTEAWIDNHYMQRFGGAVMLSFIKDALEAAKNTTQKSNNGYSVENSEQNTSSMADKALENTINIPPTAHVLPGTVMMVIVARDFDFRRFIKTAK